METFTPTKIYCDTGEIEATILIEGELKDNAPGFVESVCEGCKHWTDEKVEEVDRELEDEWGPGMIRRCRIQKLTQHIVDIARFKGGESKMVAVSCSPLPYFTKT